MGPDDGVQRVLKTGLASVGSYGVSIAVWTRSGKFFAEARVFNRGASEPQGIIGTVKAEADKSDLALGLLEMKVAQKYGELNRIRWWPTFHAAIELGQPVWVADPEAPGGSPKASSHPSAAAAS